MDRFEKADAEKRRLAQSEYQERMTEAVVKLSVKLIAAVSIIKATPESRKAMGSDKMFDAMMVSFEEAIERGRSAIEGTHYVSRAEQGTETP